MNALPPASAAMAHALIDDHQQLLATSFLVFGIGSNLTFLYNGFSISLGTFFAHLSSSFVL